MGLADNLGYAYRPQNSLQRLAANLVAFGPVSRIASHVLPFCDRWVLRLTSGRQTLTGWAAGLPVLWLTTTGVRSGQRRTSPLLGIPVGDVLVVIGSGFGQAATPGWVHNLEANPSANVRYHDRSVGVLARPASEDESARAWSTASKIYPGYGVYQERASHRQIRVFVFDAA